VNRLGSIAGSFVSSSPISEKRTIRPSRTARDRARLARMLKIHVLRARPPLEAVEPLQDRQPGPLNHLFRGRRAPHESSGQAEKRAVMASDELTKRLLVTASQAEDELRVVSHGVTSHRRRRSVVVRQGCQGYRDRCLLDARRAPGPNQRALLHRVPTRSRSSHEDPIGCCSRIGSKSATVLA
jgi:hypothetical protein